MDREPDLPDRDETLGPPIEELRLLKEQPESGFLGRIHSSINRRVFAADSLDLSFLGLFQTFFEYLSSLIQTILPPGDDARSRDDGP